MANKGKKSIVNFLMNDANIKNLEHLEDWLKDTSNNQQFKNYIKTNYIIDVSMNSFDKEKAKRAYLKKIRNDKKIYSRKRFLRIISYATAAILTGVSLVTYIFKDEIFTNTQDSLTPIIVNNNINIGKDKAILTLEDGSKVLLENGTTLKTNHATSRGGRLVYDGIKQEQKDMLYNTLTIPRGGQFFVKLSDGTNVWLNSETKFKYPVDFVEGEMRLVELIYGEAYFEVSHSTEHHGSHFKVFNKNQEVEVLGTKFNIKAYKDEQNVFTTLVDGKVSVNTQLTNLILMPKQQTKVSKINSEVSVKEVNVSNVVSWKNGNFDFNDVRLKDIMIVLSRWYDMEVSFENKNLMEEKFNGRISKQFKIEEILSSIKSAGIINNYSINNKSLIIK